MAWNNSVKEVKSHCRNVEALQIAVRVTEKTGSPVLNAASTK